MWLQTRMFLLVAALFGILYGVITGLGAWTGAGNAILYLGASCKKDVGEELLTEARRDDLLGKG